VLHDRRGDARGLLVAVPAARAGRDPERREGEREVPDGLRGRLDAFLRLVRDDGLGRLPDAKQHEAEHDDPEQHRAHGVLGELLEGARLVGVLGRGPPRELHGEPPEQQMDDAARRVAEAGALLDAGVVAAAAGRTLERRCHGPNLAANDAACYSSARRTSGSRAGVKSAVIAPASSGRPRSATPSTGHGTTTCHRGSGVSVPRPAAADTSAQPTASPPTIPGSTPVAVSAPDWSPATRRRTRGAAPTAASVARSARDSTAASPEAIHVAASARMPAAPTSMITVSEVSRSGARSTSTTTSSPASRSAETSSASCSSVHGDEGAATTACGTISSSGSISWTSAGGTTMLSSTLSGPSTRAPGRTVTGTSAAPDIEPSICRRTWPSCQTLAGPRTRTRPAASWALASGAPCAAMIASAVPSSTRKPLPEAPSG